MAQNFTQIHEAFDTAVATVVAANQTPGAGITSVTIYTENDVSNFAMQPDPTLKLGVRTTLRPSKTIVETLGPSGYVSVNGIFVIDIFGLINQGYVGPSLLGDIFLATFPRNLILSLSDGDQIQVATSSPGNADQGGWAMDKLYCQQIIVEWFGYVQP